MEQSDVVEYVKDYSKKSRLENEPGEKLYGAVIQADCHKNLLFVVTIVSGNSPLPPLLSES